MHNEPLIIIPGYQPESKVSIESLIPQPKQIKLQPLFKKRVGSPKKYSKKLHCVPCGRKRLVRLATTILTPNLDDDAESKVSLIFLKLRKFLKLANETNKSLPIDLVANCTVCNENTYYRVNANRKLQIVL